MLIALLTWSYFLGSFWVLGSGLLYLFNHKQNKPTKMDWVDTSLFGFFISLIFSLWMSLFFPLNISILILYTGIVLILLIFLIYEKVLRWPEPGIKKISIPVILIFVSFLLILINSTNRPVNADTGIYHAQTIHWIESYPVVPGLGNIHSRLAYNSSWLVVNALFSFSQLFSPSLHLLPGFMFFLISAGIITKIPKLMKKKKITPIIFGLIALILLFETNISQASSPGTDLPAIIFVLYLIFSFLVFYEDLADNPILIIFLTLLIASTLTMKLSVLPIGLILIFLFGKVVLRKEARLGLWMVVLSLLVVIPWVIRSVVMTGYMFYPIVFPNIFYFDWKIPEGALITEQEVIRAWGRMPNVNFKEVMLMPLFTWLKPWFYDFSLNRKLMLLAAFSLPISLNLFWIKPLRNYFGVEKIKEVLICGGVLTCGLFYWLFSAPDIRFGYTFIISGAAFSAAVIFLFMYWLVSKKARLNLVMNIFVVLSIIFVTQAFVRSLSNGNLKQQLVYPAEYPNLPTMPCEIFEKTILCAELYNECWYTPFPCVPKADPQVMMRGENFGDGFRRIKN